MTVPAKKRGSFFWFIPILVGLVVGASSIFDSNNDEPQTVTINGVTYTDVIPDTVKVCGDYPSRAAAPADCIESREIMDRDSGDFSWFRLIVGGLLLGVGLLGLTGNIGWFAKDETPPPGAYMLAPILLQDDGGLIPMLSDRHAAILLIVLVIAAVCVVVWRLVRKRQGRSGA